MKINKPDLAIKYYNRVLDMYNRPNDIHMVYLYGALAFDDAGDSQMARKLTLLACKYSPTPQTWLQAGGHYFKQKDLLSAEACLTQANMCDNRLPEVWAYLALVNIVLGNKHESELCLNQAFKVSCINDLK